MLGVSLVATVGSSPDGLLAKDRTLRQRVPAAKTGKGNHCVQADPVFCVGDWRVRYHDYGDWLDILRVRNRTEAYR